MNNFPPALCIVLFVLYAFTAPRNSPVIRLLFTALLSGISKTERLSGTPVCKRCCARKRHAKQNPLRRYKRANHLNILLLFSSENKYL